MTAPHHRKPTRCPRCTDNLIPNNWHPGKYPGAISRADNKTEVCSDCGVDEALELWTTGTLNVDWMKNAEVKRQWANISTDRIMRTIFEGGSK